MRAPLNRRLVSFSSFSIFIVGLGGFLVAISTRVTSRNVIGDIYSSPDALKELYRTENIIMGELKKFLKDLDQDHEYLDR